MLIVNSGSIHGDWLTVKQKKKSYFSARKKGLVINRQYFVLKVKIHQTQWLQFTDHHNQEIEKNYTLSPGEGYPEVKET